MRFQISLATLILLFIPASFAAVLIHRGLDQRPIHWVPFTYAEMKTSIANGQPVLMLGKPNYHAGAKAALETFNAPLICRSFHDGQFDAMLLEYDNWDGYEIRNLFKNFGNTKHPISLYFQPGSEPIKIDPLSADDIIEHIPHSQYSTFLWLAFAVTSTIAIGYTLFNRRRNG